MSDRPTERFSNRVADYVLYRPGYPREIITLLRSELDFREDSVVADIGSGTGISTRMFLENGNRVSGVEPNLAMRRAAEEFLAEFSGFTSVDGTAENTTLDDASVDLIVAAQAFHWFDPEKVGREFRRISKHGGGIALIWNERLVEGNQFHIDYEKFLKEFGTDYEKVRHEQFTRDVLETAFETAFRQEQFPNSQTLSLKGLRGRLLSSSYIPSPEHHRFPEMIKNLNMLFAEHQKNGKIQVLYKTKVFYTKF